MSRIDHPAETREEKISRKLIGRKKTQAHRDAIAASASGWSDEARRRSKATRMYNAEVKRKMKLRYRQIEAEETIEIQREAVKNLDLITSPRMRMMWDRKYLTAGHMSVNDLSRMWIATAKQHAFYRGKGKFEVSAKTMAKLRGWLISLGIYPERYFRSIFAGASFARSRGRTWVPYISASMSTKYFETYVEWEKRLRTNDEGWIELMKETGVSRLPVKMQDGMIESAETLTHLADAVNNTIDTVVEQYFLDLSPYLLFFMPAAQVYIAAQRGTREQHRVFGELRRDPKLQAKYKPFYDAAAKYFRIAEIQQERRQMAKERIDSTLRRQFDERVKDVRLDLVDPAAL